MNANKPRAFKLAVLIAFFSLSSLLLGYRTHADSPPQAADKNPLAVTEENLALGLDHFDAHCAVCHGRSGKADTAKGKSTRAADLTLDKVQSRTDAELFRIVSTGIPGTGMPGFGKTHKPTEIRQVVLFLRKLPTLTDEERKKLEAAIPPSARHKHGGHGQDEHHHDDHERQMQGGSTDGVEDQSVPAVEQQQTNSTSGQQPAHNGMPMSESGSSPDMAAIKQSQRAPNPEASEKPGQESQHAHMKMDEKMPAMEEHQQAPSGPSVTLADLEQLALKNNPTLGEAEAQIRSAEGRRKQAGLYPNPLVGYSGQEFAFRHFSDKSEHFFFVEQSIVTSGKLSKSRQVVAQEAVQAQADAEAQRMRVLNTVRLLYYEGLGAQQAVELRQQLLTIARQAVDTSGQLVNVGQADQPDLLETQNEAAEADLQFAAAVSDRDQVWQMLAAVVGWPELKLARLEGSLEQSVPALDEATALAELLRASPEIKRSRAGVDRAKAALARARAERIPDLFVRGAIGYSLEPFETLAGAAAGRTGPEASVEVGVRLPLFNRNQGNIASAQAGLTSAENEVKRRELALRARLASAFKEYKDSLGTVQEYKQNILPRAQRAYELYLARYQEMAAAYPQVIIAKRTLFQARVTYTDALVALQQDTVRIQGLLLTGGLDPPSGPREEGVTTSESQGIKSSAQGAGIRDPRTDPER